MKNGLVVVIALSTLLIGGTLFSQDPAVDESVAPSPLVVTEDRDPGAESFLIKCSGCHSVGHGMRTGPDLLPSTSWPEATLRPGILRMEEKTGPLPPEEVDAILSLMKDPTLAARLARQEERIAQRFAATLDAPNLREGRELFHGAKALAQGGMPCSSCHAAAGRGGTLAADLSPIWSQLGQIGLVSACEGSNFPVMRRAYLDHPIEKQEAIHLAAYLESIASATPSSSEPPVLLIALVLCALGLGGLTFRSRRPRSGVRDRLLQASVRS